MSNNKFSSMFKISKFKIYIFKYMNIFTFTLIRFRVKPATGRKVLVPCCTLKIEARKN